MATHSKSRRDAPRLRSHGPRALRPRADRGSGAGIQANYRAMQHHLALHKTVVEDLRAQLEEVCADILENGCEARKVYQARMIAFSLIQARRMLELAQN